MPARRNCRVAGHDFPGLIGLRVRLEAYMNDSSDGRFFCRCKMLKPDTLIWMLLTGWLAFAVCLGLSRLRLRFACPLAVVALLVPILYDVKVHGLLEMGGVFHLLA